MFHWPPNHDGEESEWVTPAILAAEDMEHLCYLSLWVTEHAEDLTYSDERVAVFDAWREYLVLDRVRMETIQDHTFSESRNRTVSVCLGSHVLVELSRLWFLILQPRITQVRPDERTIRMLRLTGEQFPDRVRDWFLPPEHFSDEEEIVDANGDNKEDEDQEEDQEAVDVPSPEKLVLQYTQRELVACVSFLVQHIKHVPYSAELELLFDTLFLRNAAFIHTPQWGDVLDAPDLREHRTIIVSDEEENEAYIVNRSYLIYMTQSLLPIMSRLYYYHSFAYGGGRDQARLIVDEDDRNRVRGWMTETVLPSLGQDAIGEAWSLVCDDYYEVPGDYNWLRYRHPRKPGHVVTMLTTLRPDWCNIYLAKRKVSIQNMILGVGHREDCNLLCLYAFSLHLRDHADVPAWNANWVIRHEELGRRLEELEHPHWPLLVDLFGGAFWLWHEGRAIPFDSTFDALVAWMRVVFQQQHNTCCLSKVLKRVFNPPRSFDNVTDELRPLA